MKCGVVWCCVVLCSVVKCGVESEKVTHSIELSLTAKTDRVHSFGI